MMPGRIDPQRLVKALEAAQRRKEIALEFRDSLRELCIVMEPARESSWGTVQLHICMTLRAYLKLQEFELEQCEAAVLDLADMKRKVESPILQPVMRTGQG